MITLSGSFQKTISSTASLVCNWTGEQAGNSTNITVKVYVRCGIYAAVPQNLTIRIDGIAYTESVNGFNKMYPGQSDVFLGEWSKNVSHGAGSRSVGMSAEWDGYQASTIVVITPYDLSISAGINGEVAVVRTSSMTGLTGELSSGSKVYRGDTLRVTPTPDSGYESVLTINNSTYSSMVTHTVLSDVNISASFNPKLSTVMATDADIEGVSTLTINTPSGMWAHSLKYSFGGSSPITGYITHNGEPSVSEKIMRALSVPFQIPSSFYSKIPNAKSGVCTITCYTYSIDPVTGEYGSEPEGSRSTTFIATASLSKCAPVASLALLDDKIPTGDWYTGGTGYIKYISRVRATPTATAKNSASISHVSVNGQSLGVGETHLYFPEVTADKFTLSVIDSRGYATVVQESINLIPYVIPTINAVIKRDTPTGDSMNIEVFGDFYPGVFQSGGTPNGITIRWFYRKESDATFTLGGNITNISTDAENSSYQTIAPVNVTAPFDYASEYVFRVTVEDGDGTEPLSNKGTHVVVPKGVPIFDWDDTSFNMNVDFNVNGDFTINGQPPPAGSDPPIGSVTVYDDTGRKSVYLDEKDYTITTEMIGGDLNYHIKVESIPVDKVSRHIYFTNPGEGGGAGGNIYIENNTGKTIDMGKYNSAGKGQINISMADNTVEVFFVPTAYGTYKMFVAKG